MKKIVALILSVILLVSGFSFAAERDYDSLTVGTFTPMTGYFFTDMWGSSTSDIDVRNLLHGYSLVNFDAAQGKFTANETVVSGFVVKENDLKDHVYSIALCDDLKYSDGTPVTAWDYAFTLLLMADPAIAELGGKVHNMNYLKGAEDYRAGKSEVITGVHVRSDYMFDITISKEALPFFYELSYLDVNPYPIRYVTGDYKVKVQDSGSGVSLTRKLDVNTLKTGLFGKKGYVSQPTVTSGPYMLKSFDGDTAVFAANTYYKGDAEGNKPVFKTVTYVPVTKENAAEKLASGEIDLINKAVSSESTESAMAMMNAGYAMTPYPRSGLSFVSFCCETETAGSDSVRKALAMVMDKEGFTKAYAGDNGLVTEGFYGLGQWMYQIVTGTMPAPVAEPDETAGDRERRAYEKSLEQWEELSLDGVKTWEGNAEDAAALLDKSGWSLNASGEKFDPAKDAVRARKTDAGEIITLDMKLLCPAVTGVGKALEEHFVKPAAAIGIRITVEETPWEELLTYYYRTAERDCDMIYMASNFDAAFDPTPMFDPSEEAQGYMNRTNINDQKLYKLALAMRTTEPGDTYSYCKKWVAFLEAFAESMPLIPVYTNVYFDFYTDVLQDYEVSGYLGWSGAINKAYMSDVSEISDASFIGAWGTL